MTAPALPKGLNPSTYRAAQLAARGRAGALTTSAATRLAAATDKWAASIAEQIAALPVGTDAMRKLALVRSHKIALEASAQLMGAASKAMQENRDVAFTEVQSVWQRAAEEAASSAGVPDALLGGVRTPNLIMAGAYESLGSATWKGSLALSAINATKEIDNVVRSALLEGMSPQELAKRLHPYMRGVEAFEKAFPAKDEMLKRVRDLRGKLPPELKGAAFRMRSNALRIAYSEVHNARAEAELQAFASDPMVEAVQWELSPFRGTQVTPDECDALANNDWYGLGAGVYPLDAVPLPPHPRDRCERVPVLREDPADWGKAKPKGLKRTLSPRKAKVGPWPGQLPLTPTAAKRIREHMAGLFQQLDKHASPVAMRKLMLAGEQAAAGLLAEQSAVAQLLKSAALAKAGLPITIGLVDFPATLTGADLAAAKTLVEKAAHKSTTALKALQQLGADTSKLESKLAAQKATLAAKKAAKPPVAPKLSAAPPAPAPTAPTLPLTHIPTAPPPVPVVNPFAGLTIDQLQAKAKEHGIFLVTKKAIAKGPAHFADEMYAALKGDPLSAKTLTTVYGANVKAMKPLAAEALDTGLPIAPPVAPAAVVPQAPVVHALDADNILHTKVGAQAGSNEGGFYVGKDGVKRYVKRYKDAAQAEGEHLANDIYRQLGLGAPKSALFTHQGMTWYASEVIDGVTEAAQVGKLGLTAQRANQALDGFAADLLTGNWDAPGLTLDNLVEVGGKIHRIDNGSAFLFRAQGGRKDAALLNQLTEWEGFAPGALNKNPQYGQLWSAAKLAGPEDPAFAQRFIQQVDAIEALRTKAGGWSKLVGELAPAMKLPDRAAVISMLEHRTTLLRARANGLEAKLPKPAAATPAPKVAPITAPPPVLTAPPTVPLPAPAAPIAAPAAAGPSPAAKAVAGKVKKQQPKGAALTGKVVGVSINPSLLQAADGSLAMFKKALVKAVDGDQAAIAQLQALGANTTALEGKLAKALGSAVPTASAAAAPVPVGHLVKVADLPSIKAASQVPEPLYWNGSNTALHGMKAGGVDFAKLPDGMLGFEMTAEQLPLSGLQKGTVQLAVVVKKPLIHAPGSLDLAAAQAVKGWKPGLTAAAKRQLLLDAGYDSIVERKAGKILKVTALKPDAVKVVDAPIAAKAAPGGKSVSSSASLPTKTYSGVNPAALPVHKSPPPRPGTLQGDQAAWKLSARFDVEAQKLSAADRSAIASYTGADYRELNARLRAGAKLTPKQQVIHANLEKVLAKYPLGQETTLYRGCGDHHPLSSALRQKGWQGLVDEIGEVHVDKGFMSSSTSQATAVGNFSGSDRLVLEFRAPAHLRGWWARSFGSVKHENEWIIPSGTKYRIIDVIEENNEGDWTRPKVRVIAELLP